MAGKVTVSLASHWPCVADFSGLSTYRLTAKGMEMSTPPTLLVRYGTLYHFTQCAADAALFPFT